MGRIKKEDFSKFSILKGLSHRDGPFFFCTHNIGEQTFQLFWGLGENSLKNNTHEISNYR